MLVPRANIKLHVRTSGACFIIWRPTRHKATLAGTMGLRQEKRLKCIFKKSVNVRRSLKKFLNLHLLSSRRKLSSSIVLMRKDGRSKNIRGCNPLHPRPPPSHQKKPQPIAGGNSLVLRCFLSLNPQTFFMFQQLLYMSGVGVGGSLIIFFSWIVKR